MHVLVVDDEADVIELCRISLESGGHRVTAAVGGDEAVEAVRAENPDVVLLDFMMPGMDGLSVLERLRRDVDPHNTVPVVMLSAKGRPEDALRGLAAGATAYVTKPFAIDELEELLEAVVSETPAERDLRRTRSLATVTAERSSGTS
jgi:two-component system phosphate regulon response regulator PhoB